MCLGIPGRIVEVYREHEVRMGKVDFGGVSKRVCLEHTPDAQPGQYVIVHVGFALQLVDEHEANQIFSFLENMNELGELDHEQSPDESETEFFAPSTNDVEVASAPTRPPNGRGLMARSTAKLRQAGDSSRE